MNRLVFFLAGGLLAIVVGAMSLTAGDSATQGDAATGEAQAESSESTSEAVASGDEGEGEKSEEEGTVETKVATFGAGCFWGVELRFSKVEGVKAAVSGYMGGKKDDPSYKDVCAEKTGHAEVVQVTYDPEKVSYDQLLEVFWHVHNPTQVNRQGPDWGTQYRTVIFYHDSEQQEAAERSKVGLQRSEAFAKVFGDKEIATQIVEASSFWKAEEYHQDYLQKKGQESCHVGW